jgi:hypothetical protein
MSPTAPTMTKTNPINTASAKKKGMHLKSSPLENKTNSNDDNNDSLFGDLDSQIAKMSADADAILESIRLAASSPSSNPVTPGSSSYPSSTPNSNGSTGSRKKLTLAQILAGQKQDALNQKRQENNNNGDMDDDDDDDMTDDGSVPEQVRLDLAAELRAVEKSFSSPPRLKKERMPMPITITTTSKRITTAAAAATPATTTAAATTSIATTAAAAPTATTAAAATTGTPLNDTKPSPPTASSWLSSRTMLWIDYLLVLMICLTWAIIATTMYVIVQENYSVLDDQGEIILFSSSIKDVLFPSTTN